MEVLTKIRFKNCQSDKHMEMQVKKTQFETAQGKIKKTMVSWLGVNFVIAFLIKGLNPSQVCLENPLYLQLGVVLIVPGGEDFETGSVLGWNPPCRLC